MYENLNGQLEAWYHSRFNEMYRQAHQTSQISQLERVHKRAWSRKLAYLLGQELVTIGSRLQQMGTYHARHAELRHRVEVER